MRGLSTLTYKLATNFARYDTCGHSHRLCIVPELSMSCLAVGAAQIPLLERNFPSHRRIVSVAQFSSRSSRYNVIARAACITPARDPYNPAVLAGTLLKTLHSASQRKVARASTFRIRCFFRLRDVLSAVS